MVEILRNEEKADEGSGFNTSNDGTKSTSEASQLDIGGEIRKYLATNPEIFSPNIVGKYFRVESNGDVTIGDYANNQGIWWDQSAGALDIKGGVSVDYLDIPDTTTANSFHVNTVGDTWWGATTIGSAVAKVEKDGKATFTDIVATGTINAIGGYLASGVYVGTSSSVIECENTGFNVGTSGHIRGGQTDYDTGDGFFLGYSSGKYKISIGSSTGQKMTYNGTNLQINGQGITVPRIYDSDDTWTKPTGLTMVEVICIGAGGGGAGGVHSAAGTNIPGGSGGGGGAVSRGTIRASLLGSTVTVTVGVGGAGGAGGTSGGSGSNGANGEASSFGTYLKAGGGGYGLAGSSDRKAGGGGGGVLTSASGATAGTPGVTTGNGISGQGTTSLEPLTGGPFCSEYGGATGGGYAHAGGDNSTAGGSSVFAGAGGGSGSRADSGTSPAARAGGTVQSYTPGGGGTAGTSGGNGGDGSFVGPYCGSGGGGGCGGTGANGGNGGNGSIGSGGGGGGGSLGAGKTAGTGGNGGDGRVIVIEYY